MTLTYWTLEDGRDDCHRHSDSPVGKNYRTVDDAVGAAREWLLTNPRVLSLPRYGMDWQKEQRERVQEARNWGSSVTFETRIVESTLAVAVDGLTVTLTADCEVRWLRRWKETIKAEVGGETFTREAQREEELVPWYVISQDETKWVPEKRTVRAKQWSHAVYIEENELRLEPSRSGRSASLVDAVDPHVGDSGKPPTRD